MFNKVLNTPFIVHFSKNENTTNIIFGVASLAFNCQEIDTNEPQNTIYNLRVNKRILYGCFPANIPMDFKSVYLSQPKYI